VYLSRVVTGWIAWLLALKDALRKLPVKVIRNDKLTCSQAERPRRLGDPSFKTSSCTNENGQYDLGFKRSPASTPLSSPNNEVLRFDRLAC
jgi:hypothetical protein